MDVLALPLPQERLPGREGPVRVLVVAVRRGARTESDHAAGRGKTAQRGDYLASEWKGRSTSR